MDVGANIGVFSRWALSKWSSSRVVAVEPVPPVFKMLKKNVHSSSRVLLLNRAIGSGSGRSSTITYYSTVPGESTLFPEERSSGLKLLHDSAQQALRYVSSGGGRRGGGGVEEGLREVVCYTKKVSGDGGVEFPVTPMSLDALLLRAMEWDSSSSRVGFLKIDVEGAEEMILSSSAECVGCVDRMAVEVRDVGGRLGRIVDLLERWDFEIVVESLASVGVDGDSYFTFVPPSLKLYMVYAISSRLKKR